MREVGPRQIDVVKDVEVVRRVLPLRRGVVPYAALMSRIDALRIPTNDGIDIKRELRKILINMSMYDARLGD